MHLVVSCLPINEYDLLIHSAVAKRGVRGCTYRSVNK